MTRTQARRRRKRRQKLRQIGAWTLLLVAELFAAAVPSALVAAVLLPFARWERGYAAMGSEWLLIAVVFCTAYCVIHRRVCNKIYKEG